MGCPDATRVSPHGSSPRSQRIFLSPDPCMSKKRFTYDDAYDEDDELLLDRKAKRKRERELERERQRQEAAEQAPARPLDEAVAKIVAACQENQWRQASVLCLQAMEKFRQEGQEDDAASIAAIYPKIDRSLRRQMIAAFIRESEALLSHKE